MPYRSGLLGELNAELEDLHEREREALDALGEARLRGLPGRAALSELDRVRSELERAYAASRLLQLQRGIR